MTSPTAPDSVSRSINRLTVAVYILAAVTLLNSVIFVGELVSLNWRGTPLGTGFSSGNVIESHPTPDDYNGFQDWPVDKQIKAASVVALSTWKHEDGRVKCIISEILKQDSTTAFYYKVGDEFPEGDQADSPGTTFGDGQILFFTGSPASFRFATTYDHDRVLGLGDIPVRELREKIQKSSH